MQRCYESEEVSIFWDETGIELLEQGRRTHRDRNLQCRSMWQQGKNTMFLAWRGGRVCFTLLLLLKYIGMSVESFGPVFTVHNEINFLKESFRSLLKEGIPDPMEIVRKLQGKGKEKFENLLDGDLLNATCSIGVLNMDGVRSALSELT